MTRKEFVTKATESLAEQYSPGEAKAISVRILSHFLGLSEYEYSVEPNVVIPKPYLVKIQSALEELAAGRPVQYVIGEETFAGRIFHVSEAVLIPRLDEAGRQPLQTPPVFFKADILEGPPEEIDDIDILISNPPYVCESEKAYMAPNVLDYEPEKALFVPDSDPLRFYKALAGWAAGTVKPGGKCYFEINEAYGTQTRELFENKGFSDVEVMEDFHGKPRFVTFTKWF